MKRRLWTGWTDKAMPRAAPNRFPYFDHRTADKARQDLFNPRQSMEPGLHHTDQQKEK